MERRSFMGMAGLAALPFTSKAMAATRDADKHLAALIEIARTTGLSLDDIVYWFEGVDADRILANIETYTPRKWDAEQTKNAMVAYRAGSSLSEFQTFPILPYFSSQFRMKGDPAEIAKAFKEPYPEQLKGLKPTI